MTPHLLYQLFTGRMEAASRLTHYGNVFDRLKEQEWKRLKAAGFDGVYLLGVFDHRGPIIVTQENGQPLTGERLPSVFAQHNQTLPDPALGSEASFRKLVEAIDSSGLHTIVDFVPNHTGTTHPWVTEHPDFYSGHIEFSGDVMKLNYDNPRLRDEMIGILKAIADFGVDGVRCDMAHLVPVSFWQEAIAAVRHHSPLFQFVAEAYADSVFDWQPMERLLEAGFDAVYEEFFYRNLTQVFSEGAPLSHLVDHLNHVLSRQDSPQWIHYLANHDDPLGSHMLPYHQGLHTLLMMLPGTTLLPNGSLYGRTERISHHQYEAIPDNQNELISIPPWFTHISTFLSTLNVSCTSFTSADSWLLAEVIINQKPGLFVLNTGTHRAALSSSIKLLLPGLIGNHTTTDSFGPGDFDIFFLA
jgi:hypothetical protein